MSNTSNSRGMTLIELLVVLTLIAAVILLIVPRFPAIIQAIGRVLNS